MVLWFGVIEEWILVVFVFSFKDCVMRKKLILDLSFRVLDLYVNVFFLGCKIW